VERVAASRALFESIFVFENFPIEVSLGERSRRLKISEIRV
jgi:hypothetical protein